MWLHDCGNPTSRQNLLKSGVDHETTGMTHVTANPRDQTMPLRKATMPYGYIE